MALRLRIMGRRGLRESTKKGTNTGITIQVADVHKTLASVGKMTDAGNTIIFSKGRSIIATDKDGEVAKAAIGAAKPNQTTELEKRNGVYTFDMWVDRDQTNYVARTTLGRSSNYQNIGAIRQDFAWLDDEVM